MVRWTQMRDIVMALSKAFCFALLIVFISCHKGLTAREGAVGVGRATTEAVVDASLAVLIFNFFLTMALNIIFPAGLPMRCVAMIAGHRTPASKLTAQRSRQASPRRRDGLADDRGARPRKKSIGTQEILRGIELTSRPARRS